MILVTVGMQLGFDRLIQAMDGLAPELDQEIIAQTGKGDFWPQNMEAHIGIAPDKFEALVSQSSLIVSHAGIGTILTAQRYAKPVVLMPRKASLGEHRNDHQIATAKHLAGRPGILVADDEKYLAAKIDEALQLGKWSSLESATAQQLHSAVAHFIETGSL